ncbi:MAG: elongation factor P 5-aminopentanone reductase [Oscillospiraceae bacterium]
MGMKKRALVTGASRGIGRACAQALAREGHFVAVNYLKSREQAEDTAYQIGGEALMADVSDPASVEKMFKAVGNVDILVVNAGIALQKLFTDTSPEEWRRIFAVNVEGAYNACRMAIPHMVHEKWGRIIIISSMWGLRGASCEVAYSASKAALIGMTKALSKELGPSGITVNCIAPGVIDTEMNGSLTPETVRELCEETPLCRLGTAQEVAELAAFLASDKASFITGQIISADGGFAV